MENTQHYPNILMTAIDDTDQMSLWDAVGLFAVNNHSKHIQHYLLKS